MTDISKHQLLKQCYEVCIAIEKCGASVELTKATTKCSELFDNLDELLVITPSKEITLRSCIEYLCKKHGGLRSAAKALQMDHGYLSRLREGKKTPSDRTLHKLGLRRHIHYVARDEKGHKP